MFVASLSEREAEAVVRALKYWRSHRDTVRHDDNTFSEADFTVLLAKFGIVRSIPESVDDVLREIFHS